MPFDALGFKNSSPSIGSKTFNRDGIYFAFLRWPAIETFCFVFQKLILYLNLITVKVISKREETHHSFEEAVALTGKLNIFIHTFYTCIMKLIRNVFCYNKLIATINDSVD